jgi:hypothetical protein
MGFKLQAFMSLGLDAVRSFQVARAELNNSGAGLMSPFASPSKGKPAGAPIDHAAERINQNLLRMLCSVAAVGGAGGTGMGANDALPALDALERLIFGADASDNGDDSGSGVPGGGGGIPGGGTRGTDGQAKEQKHDQGQSQGQSQGQPNSKRTPREHAKPLLSHGSSAWSDMVYAVVSLSHALRSTTRVCADPWCQKAVALLNRLLDQVHEVVGDKLGHVRLEATGSYNQDKCQDDGGGEGEGVVGTNTPRALNGMC